jgi:hypothetical protein
MSPGVGIPGIGILSDTARKIGWQLAENAREVRPDGMHRLLLHAACDTNGVRDDQPTLLICVCSVSRRSTFVMPW